MKRGNNEGINYYFARGISFANNKIDKKFCEQEVLKR